MLDNLIEPSRGHNHVNASRRIAPNELRPAATRRNAKTIFIRVSQNRGQLGLVAWLNDKLCQRTGDDVVLACGTHVSRSDDAAQRFLGRNPVS